MEERDAYLLPRVAEADFSEPLALMRGEVQFPTAFSDWQALWDRRRRDEHDNGRRVVYVEMLPAALATYCSSAKVLTVKAGR